MDALPGILTRIVSDCQELVEDVFSSSGILYGTYNLFASCQLTRFKLELIASPQTPKLSTSYTYELENNQLPDQVRPFLKHQKETAAKRKR